MILKGLILFLAILMPLSSTYSAIAQPSKIMIQEFGFDEYPTSAEVSEAVSLATQDDATYTPPDVEVVNTAWTGGCGFEKDNQWDPTCEYGNTEANFTIAVYGSSQATIWVPAFDRLGRENDWKILSYTKPSCPAADTPSWRLSSDSEYVECDEYREWFYAEMERIQPDVIVIGAGWDGTRQWDGTNEVHPGDPAVWRAGLEATVDRVIPFTGEVILIGEYVTGRKNLIECLEANQNDPRQCGSPNEFASAENVRYQSTEIQRQVAEQRGLVFIDPIQWFCTEEFCPGAVNNMPVRFDTTHANTMYVIWISGALEEQLELGK